MSSVPITYAGKGKRQAVSGKKVGVGAAPVASLTITDDPGKPGNYIVNCVNAAGDVIDASTIATITVTAADPTTNTPLVTGPNKFSLQGLKSGPATDTIVMTANDGSFGPFTGDVAITITPGGPTGFTVEVNPTP
jgi:hypothetical protein